MHIRTWYRHVAIGAERLYQRAAGRFVDEPLCSRLTENSGVRSAVAVVVARNRCVAVGAEWECIVREVFTSQHIPEARRRPPERNISFAVAGKIARNCPVRRVSKLHREHTRIRTAAYPPLRSVRSTRPEDRNVRFPVAIVIRIHRLITRRPKPNNVRPT